jgi:2-hydroxychromene-2-carboxylate isomerase
MTTPVDFYFDFSSPYGYFAATLGHDYAAVTAAFADPQVKMRLQLEVDAAIERGVFGSPYIVVDGEPFWGADRLPQLERWLAQGPW